MYSWFSRSKARISAFFLHVGANQASAGKVLLGAGGDVGEHGLNAFEAFVDAAAESLDHDADGGQRQERVEREPGADGDHEGQRARGVDDGVRRVHDRGAEQHADRVQVIGGARHDVAGAMALVVGVGKAFETREQIVAQIELDVARDADDDPASEELEDSFGDRDGEQHSGIEQKFVAGYAGVEVVGSAAEDEREEDPDAVGQENTQRARDIRPAVAFHVRDQRAQTFQQHRDSVDEILAGAVHGFGVVEGDEVSRFFFARFRKILIPLRLRRGVSASIRAKSWI